MNNMNNMNNINDLDTLSVNADNTISQVSNENINAYLRQEIQRIQDEIKEINTKITNVRTTQQLSRKVQYNPGFSQYYSSSSTYH